MCVIPAGGVYTSETPACVHLTVGDVCAFKASCDLHTSSSGELILGCSNISSSHCRSLLVTDRSLFSIL